MSGALDNRAGNPKSLGAATAAPAARRGACPADAQDPLRAIGSIFKARKLVAAM